MLSFRARQGAGIVMLSLAMATVAPADEAEPATAGADELLAAGDHAAAAAAYEAVTKDDADNAAAWFGLGSALRGKGDPEGAVEAFRRAIELGHQEQRATFHVAATLAAEGKHEKAIDWLRRLAETGSTAQAQVLASPDFQALQGMPEFDEAVAGLRPCRAREYRLFDFWIGDWDVSSYARGQERKSHNRITSIQGGCALLEEYDTPSGYTGTSLNFYDAASEQWHQTWIDNQGQSLFLAGGRVEGMMVLTSPPVEGQPRNRITWEPNLNGSIRQNWETSSDGGQTWTTVFDGMYKKRK